MKRFCQIFLLTGLSLLAVVANAQNTAASTTDSTNLKAYVGTYNFSDDSPIKKLVITTDKGDLYSEADGYGKNKLIKQDKADTYKSTSSYGSVFTFIRDAATKTVTGFTMAVQGTDLTAQKDKP